MSIETRAKCRVKCDACGATMPWTGLHSSAHDAYMRAGRDALSAGWALVEVDLSEVYDCCPKPECHDRLVSRSERRREEEKPCPTTT